MRILKHPVDGRLWWYFCPTIIAARIRAIGTNDRLGVIWVRPLDKDEAKQVEKLLRFASLPKGYSIKDNSEHVEKMVEADA